VADHGVPQELLVATMAAQRAFFALPLEQKMRIAVNKYYRGYTPMAEETLDPARSRRGDTHEGLYFGRHVEEGSEEAKLPLHGPNQWPDEALVPGYRAATEAYWEAVAAVGFRLLRLLGLSLGLGPGAQDQGWACLLLQALGIAGPPARLSSRADYFQPHFTRPMIALRPLHYSGERSSEADGLYAAGAHTDYGMLTLLATDGVPGLQICTDGTTWRGVDPLPGCFIVNLGDMLCRWTNSRYRSTLHRVVNTTGQERFSLPLFFEPNFDALVVALDSVRAPGEGWVAAACLTSSTLGW
jgi:isopenicillin N synthase-like dioxygenase